MDVAIKKLQSTMSFVQFKSLGTLRLLSQKQGRVYESMYTCVLFVLCIPTHPQYVYSCVTTVQLTYVFT